ncbi:VgrG-related protein [Nocardioides marinquilinus]|uniref:VgrG-related protein n=1 Tax=Nocardioides marinquilinus TaxID=1210400 RepID=A0ABP9Q429_9ACTN
MSQSSIEIISPGIKVDGADLAANHLDNLISLRVDLGMGIAGRTVLRFRDVGYPMSTSGPFKMGAAVVVKAGSAELITAEVTGVALEHSHAMQPELVVTADDKACRLDGATQNRTFLNQSYGDIVGTMAGEATLSAAYTGPTTVHPYLLQTGSNLAYLNAICERAGLVWWVEDGTKLKVVKAGTAGAEVPLKLDGIGLESFTVRATNTGPNKVTVRGWDAAKQAALVGVHSTLKTSESDFVGSAAGRKASARGSTALALAAPAPFDAGEAEEMAAAKFAVAAAGAVVARGSGEVNPRLKIGCVAKVEQAGPSSGSYLVTRVEHHLTRGGFRTTFTAGPVRPRGMVDLLRGPAPDPGTTLSGVFPAVVTNNADAENPGKIKVKYTAVSDQVESAWARQLTLGAGNQRGLLFVPEVNDEVLIAFEHGDSRRPVILGSLFSDKNKTPTSDDVANGAVKFRRITSRLGHVIELADGDSDPDKHILLKLADGTKISVASDKIDVVSNSKPIKLTNSQATITMTDSGDIKLEGNNIELSAKMNIKLDAKTKVDIKGAAGADLAGAMVNVKSDGVGSVEAGGPLTIKGAVVAIN